ncbi:2-C-methyl-D-erythritol 4-phosphate cytidylyltransferase [Nocardioides caeni]|uniref:IspD/TarI family cytidylyltransferase n=1 Tax=Nocardioides caeni TaxID=574700 RepID=UPI001EE99A7E|nr:2-C-methyl-D-erythritol 4-phosphate cytidylyltransferase [Nocardioides caeni]
MTTGAQSKARPRAAIVVLAAGSGTRVGAAVNKVLLPLGGKPLLAWSVEAALAVEGVDPVVVVCRPGERERVAVALQDSVGERELLLIDGGGTRQASEQAALDLLAPRIADGSIDVVAVHDGARPLSAPALFSAVIDAARDAGGGVPAVPLPGLLPIDGDTPPGSLARLVGVQTPQAFRAGALAAAHASAAAAGFDGTDTAAAYAEFAPSADRTVRVVPSTPRNLKVTFAEDVRIAERLLGRAPGLSSGR